MSTPLLAELAAGVVLALGLAWAVSRLAIGYEHYVYAVGLFGAAVVYLVFAIAGGASSTRLLVELGGVAFFGAYAYLAVGASPLLLGIGWGLHMLWDAGPHGVLAPGFAPIWYPGLCAGFDLALAAYLPLAYESR